MFKSLSSKIAIDLGSSKIKIVAIDDLKNEVWELSPIDFRAKVLEEDACLAIKKEGDILLAIGKEALAMKGRLDGAAEVFFPFHQSRILDEKAAKILIKELLKRVFKKMILSPIVMVTTAATATNLDKKILSQFFYDLGFSKVNLIASPLAAAIGAGVPIIDSSGTLFLQMGSSGMTCSAISMGSLLFNEESDFGGDKISKKIIEHLAKTENFSISLESAELLKKQVFSLDDSNKTFPVVGKTINGFSPLELKIKSSDLKPVVDLFKIELKSLVEAILKKIPPDLITDVLQKGLLLSGGLAKINGLEDFLVATFNFPIALLDEPDLLASMGSVAMLKNINMFAESLSFDA